MGNKFWDGVPRTDPRLLSVRVFKEGVDAPGAFSGAGGPYGVPPRTTDRRSGVSSQGPTPRNTAIPNALLQSLPYDPWADGSVQKDADIQKRPPRLSDRKDKALRRNNASYWDLGWQWASGTGPRHQVFTQDDPATQVLMRHDNFDRMRNWVSENGSRRVGENLSWDHNLGGLKGTFEYARQYASVASNGKAANLAATFLGSYEADFKVREVKDGYATVDVHVSNDSDMKSVTHPPLLGYTTWWHKNVEPLAKRIEPEKGPLSPTRQDYYWTERVKLKP